MIFDHHHLWLEMMDKSRALFPCYHQLIISRRIQLRSRIEASILKQLNGNNIKSMNFIKSDDFIYGLRFRGDSIDLVKAEKFRDDDIHKFGSILHLFIYK
ncbi:DFP2 [Sarcoptes scabiei]|nr:DFP2 [Sarcoptes scabiei]